MPSGCAATAWRRPSPDQSSRWRPWAYRGTPLAELGQGTVGTINREYAVRHGVDGSLVELTPLWGSVYEPSQQAELVFLADVDGVTGWGVAQGGEAGPEFPVDKVLPEPALALAVALPGDEGVGRLVVVAAPQVGQIEYLPEEARGFSPMVTLADGVAITPLEGDPGIDLYRVLDAAGVELVSGAAPDVGTGGDDGPGTEQPPVGGDDVPAPGNTVDWPTRGGVSADLYEQALTDFARAAGLSRDEVGSRLLFAGGRGDRVFILLQGWYGGDARGFA